MSFGELISILAHACAGWLLCGAIMGIGLAVTSLKRTLVIHAIGAPLIFAAVSWIYFTWFGYTTSLETAIWFISFVIGMDFLVVALLIQRKLDMFRSLLGTWVPFSLIFVATYAVGHLSEL
jgi:hypothetical protein